MSYSFIVKNFYSRIFSSSAEAAERADRADHDEKSYCCTFVGCRKWTGGGDGVDDASSRSCEKKAHIKISSIIKYPSECGSNNAIVGSRKSCAFEHLKMDIKLNCLRARWLNHAFRTSKTLYLISRESRINHANAEHQTSNSRLSIVK